MTTVAKVSVADVYITYLYLSVVGKIWTTREMTPVAEVLERAAKSDRRDCVIGGGTQPTPQTTAD